MLKFLIDTEIEYTKCFSKYFEDEKIIRFRDEHICNMFAHNYTLVKCCMSEQEIYDLIVKEIMQSKKEGKSFLQVEYNFNINSQLLNSFEIKPEVTIQDYMYITSDKFNVLCGNNECTIKSAKTEDVMEDGIRVDIEANSHAMGEDFAIKRIQRKAMAYRAENNLDFFLCYHNEVPIGNCELFFNKKTAKIEDFDILEKYQRKGFGTSVLKELLKRSSDFGAETVYVLTDSEDTAKEMYKKCGFLKIGAKTILNFTI
ncbi:GNAT family N-acetyltransferase [Clostridium tagluense]|uniref:GNAT family N-acetyltransferase n=1 Tax=Clostridium tagluense TaxID=360422 RepID=UPI001C6F164D|nr:GNAT family N-acetyltransferase [Clostridium tagluense]MBW9156194.1 GNAT family N-acetyltransferase [Clostridium tagluense]WLC65567.1 GNAT family N-acetyltransferase [Clostridium tagluense]